MANWRNLEKLKLLNLLYDVTPAAFVTAVACDAGIVPTTSVPVILREYVAVPRLQRLPGVLPELT